MRALPVGYADVCLQILRTGDPEPMCVTWGCAVGTNTVDTTASQNALAVAAAFPPGAYSPAIKFDKVIVRQAVEGDVPEVSEANVSVTGVLGSSPMATQNVAILVKKLTTHGGRQGRGRMFLPFIFETEVDEVGVITAGALTKYETHVDNLLSKLATPAAGVATPMVLLHGPNRLGTTPPPYPVIALSIDPRVATQRRRMRR